MSLAEQSEGVDEYDRWKFNGTYVDGGELRDSSSCSSGGTSFCGVVSAGTVLTAVDVEVSSGGRRGTKVMLNFLAGAGGSGADGGGAALASSCTGSKGKKVKLGLRRVGVCCWGVGIGDERGVIMGGSRILVGGLIVDAGGAGPDGCVGSAGVVAVAVDESGVGVLVSETSCEGGRRGRRRIGTESKYGRIVGSTADADSSRFFHRDGVRDGAAAKREMGNGGFDCEGGDIERGIDVDENGCREQDEGARGSDFMISFSSRISLIEQIGQCLNRQGSRV